MQSRFDNYVTNSHSDRQEEIEQIFHHFEKFVTKLKRIFEDFKKETITKKSVSN